MSDGPNNSRNSFHSLPLETQNRILFNHNKWLLDWVKQLEGTMKAEQMQFKETRRRLNDLIQDQYGTIQAQERKLQKQSKR
jgi:hypothetical protein